MGEPRPLAMVQNPSMARPLKTGASRGDLAKNTCLIHVDTRRLGTCALALLRGDSTTIMSRMDHNEVNRLTFLWMRRSIGALGMSLPFVVAGVCSFGDASCSLQPSISAYYHTEVGYLFVGMLLAVAILLWSYPGYDRDDNLAGNIAALFALGVFLFPPRPDWDETWRAQVLGSLHFAAAVGMFVMLAIFCLVLFRRTKADAVKAQQRGPGANTIVNRLRSLVSLERPTEALPPLKKWRNAIYTLCGWAIVACLIAVALYKLTGVEETSLARLRPVFFLEGLALWAFGLAWTIKGDTLFRNET